MFDSEFIVKTIAIPVASALIGSFVTTARNEALVATKLDHISAAIQRIEQLLERFGDKVGHLQSGVEELARWVSSRRSAGAQRARAFLQGSTPGAAAANERPDKDDAIQQSTRILGIGRR